MKNQRPGQPRRTTTTPHAGAMIEILGGQRDESVTVTNREMNALRRLYGFVPEKPQERPPEPELPSLEGLTYYEAEQARRDHERALDVWRRWQDPRVLMQAGADRNTFRYAREDGMRLIAWLARYCEPGQDPLKVLVQLCVDAGFDVEPEDVEWADAVGEEEALTG